MSIKIICVKCGKELDEPGALLFSPPKNRLDKHVFDVTKAHLCYNCWNKLIDMFIPESENEENNVNDNI